MQVDLYNGRKMVVFVVVAIQINGDGGSGE